MVDDAAIEAFARDGAVVVRGIVSPAELDLLATGIEWALANPSERAIVASNADDPGRFVEDFIRWPEVSEIEEVALRSAIPEAAAALMDSMSTRFYHDHILVKEPGTTQRTPWHQDQPYYNVDGRGISAWVPIDPVPKAGSPEFWAGSHLGPWRLPRTFLDDEAKWFPEGSLAEMPDGEVVFFRYYDPMTLRSVVPGLTPEQKTSFFGNGAVRCFYCEGEEPGEILEFPAA